MEIPVLKYMYAKQLYELNKQAVQAFISLPPLFIHHQMHYPSFFDLSPPPLPPPNMFDLYYVCEH